MKDARGFIPTERAGFTLLELLMVVIIIAILASVALPQYLRVAERSRSAEALQNLAAIRSSESRFKAASATGVYDASAKLTGIDLDVPLQGTAGGPGTANWDFKVDGTVATSNVLATRRNAGGKIIQMDIDTGNECSDDPQYGLTAGLAC